LHHAACAAGLCERDLFFVDPDNSATDVAQHLLDAGADVDARDVDGATPLCIAAFLGRMRLADLLLKRGADQETTVGTERTTPLQVAVCRQQLRWYDTYRPILNVLLVAGAKILPEEHLPFDTWHR